MTNFPVKVDDKLLAWGRDIEQGTFEQATKASRLPFVEGHLALMPDAHVGKGATIGSVIPTRGAIIPSAVGVDIGCGMVGVETDLTADGLPDDLDKLHGWIAKVVPAGVGKGHDKRYASETGYSRLPPYAGLATELDMKQTQTLLDQFGSLGSGNHFVEVCLDERTRVWVVLHSGSRGVGNQLATHHINEAKGLMKKWFIELDDPTLAYLVAGTRQFDAYIMDMMWAQEYALANREQMMDAVLKQLFGFVGADPATEVGNEVQRINTHHNYTVQEHHFGKNVWLTRKGAIRAGLGDLGIIPGSMGTASYIVEGLGNRASYTSCSHGAGRKMSRGQARRELTVDSLNTAMAGRSWNDLQAEALLDEHPTSYKTVDRVMEDQSDLVRVVHTLRQIVNFKGA